MKSATVPLGGMKIVCVRCPAQMLWTWRYTCGNERELQHAKAHAIVQLGSLKALHQEVLKFSIRKS